MEQTLAHSTSYLLSVAGIAVILLLFLIMKLKVHAFVSLVIVSAATALATGIPYSKIMPEMLNGFGGTLASVALLVGLGAMIGKVLEQSGGAQVLADTLIRVLGEKRAPLALGIASLLFAFPIFFDAGLVVMLPVVLSVGKRLGGSLLRYALPATGAFSVMHVFLPPHPGPVAASGILGANVGMLVFVGIIIALPTWYISSYLFGLYCGKKWQVDVPDLFKDESNNGKVIVPPKFRTVLGILLTPVILIFLNTGITTLQSTGALPQSNLLSFITIFGQTPIALLITLLECLLVFHKEFGMKALEGLCEKALGPICSVVLVTGAGGMFGGILRASGIGDALAGTLSDLGIPVILAAFIIAACLRVAQGSATVALTTTAALVAPIVAQSEFSQLQLCAIVASVAAGSVVLSHFNDSGFWLFKGLYGVDEKTTLRTWTVLETLIGCIGFALACVIFVIF
ncbi:MAG: GntP family permease [Candidatus Anaerobiospirillum pullicola]|uniref:GntP family permease n=1 Tax=Candidatus Anaerobiospirillum pullicola TaxID=2838451 RepID=A0A948TGP4_9GAMM|nr:GntP family permease [Candidatus Anaerobiospirillum pullicola]